MPERRHRLDLVDGPRAIWTRRAAGAALVAVAAFGDLPARGWPVSTYRIAAAVAVLALASLVAYRRVERLATRHRSTPPAAAGPAVPRIAHPEDFQSPRLEALAAGAGLLTLATLAIAFALLSLAAASINSAAAAVARGAAFTDASLLAISALPGYPLHGGRLLRALIWRVTDDKLGATRLMTWYGQAIGWGLMLVGLVLLGGSPDPVIAAAALVGGWLLRVEARAGYRAEQWRELSQRVPVYRVALLNAPRIADDRLLADTIDDVLEAAGRLGQGGPAFVVDASGRVTGAIGLNEFRRVERKNWGAVTAGEAMVVREQVATVAQSAPIGTLADVLAGSHSGYAFVTADGGQEPIGVLGRARLEFQVRRLLREHPGTRGESAP